MEALAPKKKAPGMVPRGRRPEYVQEDLRITHRKPGLFFTQADQHHA